LNLVKASERAWRDSELSRTDILSLLDDYDHKIELSAYRRALKDYPESADFPNGDRPKL